MIERLVAVLLILAGLPLLLGIAVVVGLGSRGGVLHCQTRLGQHGRPFRIYKFRTLHSPQGGGGLVAPVGDERVTGIGAWLRATRLDELPQLVNIVKGEMSFIGPRPARPELWDGVAKALRERALAHKPGLTSPATVRFICEDELLAEVSKPARVYRNILYPARVALDVRFFENRARWSDFSLLGLTLAIILGRRDVDACRRRLARLLDKHLPEHKMPASIREDR